MDRVTSASDDQAVSARLTALVAQYGLPADAAPRLRELLDLVQQSHHSLTAVRDPIAGVEVHIADSLAGLRVDAIQSATRIADLGSGAGFPGLVLALARPEARVVLVESVGKKAVFLEEAAEHLRLENVEVVRRPRGGLGGRARRVRRRHRAGARSPRRAARVRGAAAAGRRRAGGVEGQPGQGGGDRRAGRRARSSGWRPRCPRPSPGPEGSERHLYLSRKLRPTPPGYPRRPGMAAKRPLGGSSQA